MIQANISKENKQQTITATGSVPELLGNIAVLIGGIYTQFKNTSPGTALLFRQGVMNMVNDPNAPVWQTQSGQIGIVFQKPQNDTDQE